MGVNLVASSMELEAPPPLLERPRPRLAQRRPAVLVVDDDASLRAVIAVALRRAGYHVLEAADGMDAIDRVAEARSALGVRLGAILTDVCMPRLSGLDVLTVLHCASVRIPVILMTAFLDKNVREEARTLGATAVLAKPLDLATIVASVDATVRSNGRNPLSS